MTAISSVTAQNLKLYQQSEIKKLDKRHEELTLEERRIKYNKEVNEQKRIELARQMNRAVGQNVDRMA
jgi:predicted NACHT family NTPase